MDSLFHVLVSTCLALTFSGKCLSPLPPCRIALSAAEQSPLGQLATYKKPSHFFAWVHTRGMGGRANVAGSV